MTTHQTYHDGEDFEVTEADKAVVSPLGGGVHNSEQAQRGALVRALKKFLVGIADAPLILPEGIWDAWLDDGRWDHDPKVECEDVPMCGLDDHMVCLRPPDPDRDQVFVRLSAGSYESCWDVEVFTRNPQEDGTIKYEATVAINGEEYPPEDCLRDLGALLAVFRLYVSQGRI